MTQMILDVSRLISRMHYSTPSGVDRVEMAYVRGLLARFGAGLDFAAVHPTGLYGRLRRDAILPYFDELERRWSREENSPNRRSVISNLPLLFQLLPRRARGRGRRAVYIQVSPHHLAKTGKIRRILAQENAQFACLVHDLIPMEFPEYARPDGAALHQRRIETVTSLADLVAATPVPANLSAELECLAGAVYFESKSESLAGQLAVARVIVARSHSGRYPSSYCGVVFQPSQFSFVRGHAMPAINHASRFWANAARIAVIADQGSWKSPVEGALFFHAARVSPAWGKTRLAAIGGHIFYR